MVFRFGIILCFSLSILEPLEAKGRPICASVVAVLSLISLEGCQSNPSISCSPHRPLPLASIDGLLIVRGTPENFPSENRKGIERKNEDDYSQGIEVIRSASSRYPQGFLERVLRAGVVMNPIRKDSEHLFPAAEVDLSRTPYRIDIFVRKNFFNIADENLRRDYLAVNFAGVFNHETGHSTFAQFGDSSIKAQWFELVRTPYDEEKSHRAATYPPEPDSSTGLDPWYTDKTPPNWEEHLKDGFITKYARTNFGEDFAETSAVVFSPYFSKYWPIIKNKYPTFAKKILLVIEVYHRADSRITLDYLLQNKN